MMMFEIAVFLFWLIVIVGLIAIIVITPVYTSHIAPSWSRQARSSGP
jgi:hypothetical protein